MKTLFVLFVTLASISSQLAFAAPCDIFKNGYGNLGCALVDDNKMVISYPQIVAGSRTYNIGISSTADGCILFGNALCKTFGAKSCSDYTFDGSSDTSYTNVAKLEEKSGKFLTISGYATYQINTLVCNIN